MKNKPFPWRCPNCAKKEVYAAIVPYIAKIKHNECLYDVNVSELTVQNVTLVEILHLMREVMNKL